MVTEGSAPRPGRWADPAFQAFVLLRVLYTVVPIVFGLDKFVNVLTDWSMYLAPVVDDVVPLAADRTMTIVGAVEILAGLVVAFSPRLGGYLVAIWLGVIIVNLLTISGYYDVAGRDLGLLVGAVALARLAQGRHDAEQALEDARWAAVLPRDGGEAVGAAGH